MNWDLLPIAVRWTIAAIFALLVIGSLAVVVLRRLHPDRDYRELGQRVNTWWVIVVLFTLAMVLSRTVSVLFFALISVLALREFFALVPQRPVDRRALLWAFLMIPLQYAAVWLEWYGLFIIAIPVFAFLVIPARMLIVGQTEGYIRATGTTQWGLMIAVFSVSHAAFLLILRPANNLEALTGPGLMLFLVALTQLNDVLQYIWGKSLGRHKIVPSVSPGKTWEGFLGGVASSTTIACGLGPLLTPLNLAQSAIAGFLISVGGFFGDINLSAVKRDLGVKDTGKLLPGHGGILDRVDSLTYTAPIFFHYVYYLFDWQTFGASGRFIR